MTFTTNIAITSHWEHFGVLGALLDACIRRAILCVEWLIV
jgi:hypothetical protein